MGIGLVEANFWRIWQHYPSFLANSLRNLVKFIKILSTVWSKMPTKIAKLISKKLQENGMTKDKIKWRRVLIKNCIKNTTKKEKARPNDFFPSNVKRIRIQAILILLSVLFRPVWSKWFSMLKWRKFVNKCLSIFSSIVKIIWKKLCKNLLRY